VDVVVVQDVGGSVAAIAEGVSRAAKLVRQASRARRADVPLSELTIGVECGGSDTTSGLSANPVIGYVADRVVAAGGRVIISETSEFLGVEDVFATRAVTSRVRDEFLLRVTRLEEGAIERGVDLLGTNPVPDNIAGGLTTIEEKALGAVVKAGTAPLAGVLDYAEAPGAPGLYFMDTPAPAVESMTALAAGGANLILFGTGVSNTIGNPIAPTIKVTGNPRTATLFEDDIDFDVSAILENGANVDEMGERLFEHMLDVASGTVTCSEVLGQTELAISRFHPSI
jgi:altronate dehydratase large subunit